MYPVNRINEYGLMVVGPSLSLSQRTFAILAIDIVIFKALLKSPFCGKRGYRMSVWACACALLAVLALFAEHAQAADAGESVNEARVLLKKIGSAEKSFSYEGTFIFRRES